jgi:hypothetical protein
MIYRFQEILYDVSRSSLGASNVFKKWNGWRNKLNQSNFSSAWTIDRPAICRYHVICLQIRACFSRQQNQPYWQTLYLLPIHAVTYEYYSRDGCYNIRTFTFLPLTKPVYRCPGRKCTDWRRRLFNSVLRRNCTKMCPVYVRIKS